VRGGNRPVLFTPSNEAERNLHEMIGNKDYGCLSQDRSKRPHSSDMYHTLMKIKPNSTTDGLRSTKISIPTTNNPDIVNLLSNAQAGDSIAQYQLGNRYSAGEGVSKDVVEAVRWYRLAADQGHELALIALRKLNQS